MTLEHGQWMSWEAGVDLAAVTRPALGMPNVIVHVARMVHTPVGSAPSGMLLWQPDPEAAPAVMGFVSSDPAVGAYFGPKIFAGTPFEPAPVLSGAITVTPEGDGVTARVETGGHVFELRFEGLGRPYVIDREPAAMTPFRQQGLEQRVQQATLRVDGEVIEARPLAQGIAGGPGAVWAACGLYAR